MNSIRSLLAGIVDYAGLFPPAALPMEAAVRNYAHYRTDEDCDLLGRFVVPAGRLDEFTNAARGLLDRGDGSDPWLLSALAGDDPAVTRQAILDFNSSHSSASDLGHAVCDSIEIQAQKTDDIGAAVRTFPDSFRLFFEIAPDPDPVPLLREVARNGGSAKLRTGGVTETAFPSSTQIIRFIAACHQLGVPFKATAGLHHPLRSIYPLTYEAGSPRAMMFGYLNLFLAAAFVRIGMPETEAREILEERSVEAFSFGDKRISWRGHNLNEADLRATRSQLALSFGSCSFREPVDEARALNLL
jgi:hypothetical protein